MENVAPAESPAVVNPFDFNEFRAALEQPIQEYQKFASSNTQAPRSEILAHSITLRSKEQFMSVQDEMLVLRDEKRETLMYKLKRRDEGTARLVAVGAGGRLPHIGVLWESAFELQAIDLANLEEAQASHERAEEERANAEREAWAERKKRIIAKLPPFEQFDDRAPEHLFEGIEIGDLIELVYSERPFSTTDGEFYNEFYQALKEKAKKTDYQSFSWDKPFPRCFDGLMGKGEIAEDCSYKEASYKQGNILSQIPGVPKTMDINEKISIYWISHEEVWVETYAYLSGNALAQSIHVLNRTTYKQIEEGVVANSYGKTFFSGAINVLKPLIVAVGGQQNREQFKANNEFIERELRAQLEENKAYYDQKRKKTEKALQQHAKNRLLSLFLHYTDAPHVEIIKSTSKHSLSEDVAKVVFGGAPLLAAEKFGHSLETNLKKFAAVLVEATEQKLELFSTTAKESTTTTNSRRFAYALAEALGLSVSKAFEDQLSQQVAKGVLGGGAELQDKAALVLANM